jgi:hypothetical protein
VPKYFDADGNEIGFMAAGKFQAKHPIKYVEAQRQFAHGGLTFRETVDANRLGLTPDELQAKIADEWWAAPDAFKSLGLTKTLSLTNVSYYGGWPEHQSPEGKSSLILKVDKTGIALRKFKAVFTIPWEAITDVVAEGPETAERRFTATRLVALGPLGLAFKKDRKGSKEAIITVATTTGDEAIFHIAKALPRDISPKLEPLAIRARRAAAAGSAAVPDTDSIPSTDAAPDIAAQIEKLADLHAKGIVTDEEFTSKKADLLGRM